MTTSEKNISVGISFDRTYGVVRVHKWYEDRPDHLLIKDFEQVFRRIWAGGWVVTPFSGELMDYIYKRQKEILKRKLGHLYR